MSLENIPLFQMLKAKLHYTSERQKLIAQNVANTDTPGYAPLDLRPFQFRAFLARATASQAQDPEAGASNNAGFGLSLTHPMHISSGQAGADIGVEQSRTTSDSEVRLDGNKVVLEDEMAKMTETRLDHEAALTFYQQSLQLLRTASKAPGK